MPKASSYCPSCGKKFKDHSSVAHHMSQPLSRCNTWLNDLIQLEQYSCSLEDHVMEVDNIAEPYISNSYELVGSMDSDDVFSEEERIKDLSLSFHSARDGPCWKSQVITTTHPMKLPIVLYWCDSLECISNIFNHPLFHDFMDYSTCRVYTCVQKACHVYTEWMTGDCAWEIQSTLPVGATLLSTILSSDKTTISSLTGDHVAHPLLISLANLHMNTHSKLSTHSFVLTVLLPVPKFVHKKKHMKGVLQDRLIHQCLSIILHPLKQAAEHGIILSDPIGSTTLAQLAVICSHADPNDLEAYFREAQKFCLNGPITGFQHFREGILKLKQVTGHCHHDIQQSIIAVICALMQFCYLVQLLHINKNNLKLISGDLDEFHTMKDTIIAAGAHWRHHNKAINNWHIPKLELMQSIVPSIHNSGVISQWTADITEYAQITEIKDPARSSNNCRRFELATNLLDHDQSLHSQVQDVNVDPQDDVDTDTDETIDIQMNGPKLQHMDSVPLPLCSFIIECTAFHLSYDSAIRKVTVNEIADKFGLPDLWSAIADYLQHEATFGHQYIHPIGGPRRAEHSAILSFDNLQVWIKIWLQDTEFHNPRSKLLSCHVIAQLRLIMHLKDQFLTYVQCFNISGDHDLITQLHLLKRAKRSNETCIGGVVSVNLIPHFGAVADMHLTAYNSLEHASEFWLNPFWDKNTFFPLSA
ncbi:uncharacterized protein EDB93DRAFT_1243436 [Suillus bovinus]|uniref:uncharacterized protein n=1 Tax=Suillus bovinus TaxID=48563 RepID=UPI001B873EF3|nr:uncharacterized protein EDB93DRAFT_1243436 [Suillus bovinus]KAG2129257.1 hypothetical protein EDB93DRAFT_1243436 [Suillus bovinus]